MVDMTRSNSLFYMYGGHTKRVVPDQKRGDCDVVQDLSHCRQGGQRRDVHRVWLDRRPGVRCCYWRVDRAAIGALTAMGGSLNTMFQSVSNVLTTAAGG